jgi:hypothetical protein
MHRTGECPSFISSCQFEKRSKRWIASTSDSKEDGCTVIAVVFTRSHPEPGSQAHLRQFWYCGARAHGNDCHCAPLLSLGKIPRNLYSSEFRKLGRIPQFVECGLFQFTNTGFKRNPQPNRIHQGEETCQ